MFDLIINVGALYLMSRNLDFVFMTHKTWKTNHFWSFKDFQFTVELLYKEGLTWKIYFRYLWTCKQQINNSLKSDTFLIPPIFILHTFQDSCLSGSKFFWVHVFQDSGFLGPGFSRSRFSRVQVYQGPGSGFRSNPLQLHGNHTSA